VFIPTKTKALAIIEEMKSAALAVAEKLYNKLRL
jgi:hypothetical protein